ncbi:hypothetical protein LOD99_1388 [Oopsacas minuta]|uniref:Uncharacterized protein n=1 Tax=Oopsacas minuta TaxID=111878 RepID=A0AAV7K607_9METZ|nr:hypothetical protein LOD99_1388 [Oopsacas minuta]
MTKNLEKDTITNLRESILRSLSQDPLLSDLNENITLQDLQYKIRLEEEGCIKIKVKKFDGNKISKFQRNQVFIQYKLCITSTTVRQNVKSKFVKTKENFLS